MGKPHPDLPKPDLTIINKRELLESLKFIDDDHRSKERVLRLETAFRGKISILIGNLPSLDARFQQFRTSPYVLMIHALKNQYSRISQIEKDILPAKQFSSMETSAGRMVEEVVLPVYGWECVKSPMQSSNSALDGRKKEKQIFRHATLKSGPRCLNDEMSENFADAIINFSEQWAIESGVKEVDFTYGVLYGTQKQSNKKDWHILRKIKEKIPSAIEIDPAMKWHCRFVKNGVSVNVTVRIGLDWWNYLGGDYCFIEVLTGLIRACVEAGTLDGQSVRHKISDLNEIVSMPTMPDDFNVALLQKSQLPWLFLSARHYCDSLI